MINVLFVCTGNTCRSPMAEALLKSRNLDGVEVRSAGIYAMQGQGASLHAKNVLEQANICQNHSSRLISEADMEWATYILTMTSSHKAALESLYPAHKGKVYTLKGFTEGEDGDIYDPFGGSREQYEETFRELDEMIQLLADKMN